MRSAVACCLISCIAMMLAAARGASGAPPPLHYYYYDQPVALDVALDRVAVLDFDGFAPGRRAGHDLRDAATPSLQAPGWRFLETPGPLARAADMLELVRDVAARLPMGGFVSPVFHDEYGPQIIKPTINVGFHRDVHPALAEVIIAQSGAGEIIEREWGGMPLTYKLRPFANNGFDVLAAANALAERPEVMWAEPGRIVTARMADTFPNDTLFPDQWNLHNTGQNGGNVDLDMDLPEAWDTQQGRGDVIVVVLDCGTQLDHPDMRVMQGVDFTGDGSFGGSPYNQCDNHGTGVAGVISAIMNNGLGIAGICPLCQVVPARVVRMNVPCDGFATGDPDDVVDALTWAQANGYWITNASLGLPLTSSLAQKYADTRAAGMVHFAATGNEGTSTIYFPASSPAVNAVRGVDRNGVPQGNYGTGLTYTVPSVAIEATDRTGADGNFPGDYGAVSGTSIASPQAAAVAALLRSQSLSLTPDDIDYYMQITARDFGVSGYDTIWGYGVINAHNALLALITEGCGAGLGSCFAVNPFDAGCEDPNCCLQVCDFQPGCCDIVWDSNCVQIALDLCSTCGQFGTGDCHVANGTPSCEDGTCCKTVCTIDPTCCDDGWDAACVALAEMYCSPANDDCANAMPILTAGRHPFNNTNATRDGLDHAACESLGQVRIERDVWYCFIAPSAGEVTVRTCGLTGVDTKLAVYDGCGTCPAGDGQLLGCDDNACGVGQSSVTFNATYHGNYLIRIGSAPGQPGGTGEFIIEYPAYGSDLCITAAPITGEGAFAFDNSVATNDGLTHPTCPTFDGDLWFRWTAPALGEATISTCEGASIDTTLAVYDADGASCPPIDGDLLACNDDACGLQSQVTVDVAGGKDYFIRVGTYPGTARGGGTFSISLLATPVNDYCDAAAPIDEGTYPFSTIGAATDGPPLPSSCDEGSGLSLVNDIWYRYVASCGGQVTVDLCGSGYDTRLAIYRDDGCPGTLVACNDDACDLQSQVTFLADAGSAYYIRVGGYSGSGSGTMVVTCSPPLCPADTNGDGMVDVTDLLDLLAAWGPCGAPCPPDTDGSGDVTVTDLLTLLAAWGPCP